MMSLAFGSGGVLAMLLILAWPKPAVPPLNPQYRNSEEDPAWRTFERQELWYRIVTGVLAIIAAVLNYAAVTLLFA